MREKLNDNPMAQMAVVGLLLVVAVVFLLGKMGGGAEGEEGGGSAAADAAVAAVETELEAGSEPARLPAPGTGPGAIPPPPREVVSAYNAGATVAILFVRDGGIDDRLVAHALPHLDELNGVATFVVPAHRLARYVAIAQGVDLDRLPALVVLRPKNLARDYNPGFVSYGFQSPQSIVQAVVDARYNGDDLAYHP